MRDIHPSSTAHPGPAARIGRRRLLQGTLLTLGSAAVGAAARLPVWAQGRAPAVVTPDRLPPGIPSGVQSGDVTADRAIVWSKTTGPRGSSSSTPPRRRSGARGASSGRPRWPRRTSLPGWT